MESISMMGSPKSLSETFLPNGINDSLVVKGFNVISAWALQLGPKDASRQVYICSNNIQARQQVIELARQLNFIPVDLGSLSSAREIENLPLRLFTLWRGPVVVAISLATFFFLYSFVRDVIHPYARNQQSDFYKIPIEIVNKTLPIVAITLLSLVYLAGLLAAAYQLYYGTKYRRFPPWLETWLQCRKQLGLLSFFFASVHVAYSLCLPMRRSERYLFLNMAYQQVHANIENSWNEEEVWRIEMYISFGIMSLGLLSLLAVTSIPSVSNALNWREFSFIQSTLGYVALLISTFHVLIYGWKRAFEEEYYRFYTPPNFVLALVLPSIVILVAQACPTLCDPMDCSTSSFLSFTISWSLLKLMSIESVMSSNHLILWHPLPSVFPSIRVFFNDPDGQSTGASASASVLPMNIQG
ncbi:metalloreductase STEAP2 isoform X3 [Ovis aries]|uniref:metalloreductase STEAP2 isoform X3 n=1 Tax=Ovis aries TaxID=9940 RepID=UPI00295276D7|nr:metalloreductase STEAP2 isoform X3 [Ovis aries]